MIIYIVGGRKKLEERRVRQDKMIGVRQAAFGTERPPAESVEVSRPRTRLKDFPSYPKLRFQEETQS
jgi:hypothetical protein